MLDTDTSKETESIAEQDTQPLGSEDKEPTTDKKPAEDKSKETKPGEEETPIDVSKITVETRARNEERIEYGDDIDKDDVNTIGKILEKQTAGTKKQMQTIADRLEVDTFIQERPEFTKYKPAILKYLENPVWNQIPIKYIASAVASDDLMKIGARKEREAQSKANATKDGGSQVRTQDGGATDWSRVPKAAFEEQKRRILQGGS